MSLDDLRSEIIRLGPWHHDMEVAPGVWTGEVARGTAYPAELGTPSVIRPTVLMPQLVRDLFPGGLGGRSVLDCACNAGGYLFAAKQQGAGRCFGFDAREHWIRQARFLSRHLPSENVEFDTRELASLPALGLEPFDVTLFFGIFYHLPDPMTGLRMAADLTKELLIVNTAFTPAKGDALIVNPESTVEVMSGVNGLAWLPSGPRVMKHILNWCGFPHTRLLFSRPGTSGFHRLGIMAARNETTFQHFDTLYPPPRRPWYRRIARRLLRRR